MTTSAWDDMKRVREEEYFQKQEQAKKERLKEQLLDTSARLERANALLESFTKGHNPITNSPFFKTAVQEHILLDCPEDDLVLLSHASLLSLIESLQNDDKQAINAWKTFLQA